MYHSPYSRGFRARPVRKDSAEIHVQGEKGGCFLFGGSGQVRRETESMLRRAVRLLAFCVPASLALFLLSVVPRFGALRGATAQSQDAAKAPAARKTVRITRAPLRHIEDPNPSFSSVSVDVAHNEIVLEDENLDRIVAYGRLDNTPKKAAFTEPKRIIGGSNT